MSRDRAFSLIAWLLFGVAGFSVALSLVAMITMGVPEPSLLGFAAVAAAAYGRHLMSIHRALGHRSAAG